MWGLAMGEVYKDWKYLVEDPTYNQKGVTNMLHIPK